MFTSLFTPKPGSRTDKVVRHAIEVAAEAKRRSAVTSSRLDRLEVAHEDLKRQATRVPKRQN